MYFSRPVFTAYLHSNRGDISSFVRKNFVFGGISTVIFLVFISGGAFRLSVSGKEFFLQSRLYVSLEISILLIEICKLCGFCLIFV